MMSGPTAAWLGALAIALAATVALWLRHLLREAASDATRHLQRDLHRRETALRTTSHGYWFIDDRGLGVEVNDAMCRLLGRPREHILGRSVFEFFEGQQLARLRQEIDARRLGKTGAYEITITRPDGSLAHCLNTATPLLDSSGRRLGSVGLWSDITPHRATEAALRTYERAANTLGEIVSVIDETGHYRLVNDAWCRAFGRTREETLTRHYTQVLPELVGSERVKTMLSSIGSGQHRTIRGPVPGVAGRVFETHYYPITETAQGMPCVALVSRDVTLQEQLREEVAAGTETLRAVIDATGDAIFASDAVSPDEPVRLSNQRTLTMWGIAKEPGAPLTPDDIMDAAVPLFVDPQAEVEHINEVIASERRDESVVRLRDGRVVLRRCVPAHVGDRVVRVWSFSDITAAEHALELAQRSAAEQRALLEAFPGLIARLDAQFNFTYANDSVARSLGVSVQALLGRDVQQVLGPAAAARLRPRLERCIAGEQLSHEWRRGTLNEEFGAIQIELTPGIDPASGLPAVYAFGFDVTRRKLTEQRLKSTRRLLERRTGELHIALNHMAQGIVGMDAQGVVYIVNQRARELLTLPPELLREGAVGKEVYAFQVRRGDFGAEGRVVDADGRPVQYQVAPVADTADYVRRTVDGRVLEIKVRAGPNGGRVHTYSDVTDYRRALQALRDSDAQARTLLDAFPGIIGAFDAQQRYTYVNTRLAELLGREASEVIGRHRREVLGGVAYARNLVDEQLARQHGSHTVERRVTDPRTRETLVVEITHVMGARRGDGSQQCYVFGTDITARKQAEAQLLAARDEAERANRAKSEFLSRMSHELRTPLNAILGFCQLLQLDEDLGEQRREWVQEMAMGGRHLLELINDVLDLARVEAGRVSINNEAVALLPLVQECLTLVRPLAQAQEVSVEPAQQMCDVRLQADRTRLKQVMLNLLSNAVKYNRRGGSVQLQCGPEPQEAAAAPGGAGWIRVSVRDSGAGLTQQQCERLFVPFERLDADQGQVEGTGIGLALSKRLVQLMGGRIGVHSQPGVGSTFWFSLPLAEGARDAGASSH